MTYGRNFSQRELMLIFGDFLSFNPNTKQTEVDYAVVRAAAMRAYQDKEYGWHTSISNKGLTGVTGVTKPLSLILTTVQPTLIISMNKALLVVLITMALSSGDYALVRQIIIYLRKLHSHGTSVKRHHCAIL